MPLSKIAPAYPPIAAARKVSGAVLIDVKVHPAGEVVEASVVSGPKLLREAARKAALRWRFKPSGVGNGVRSVRLTFIFHEASYVPPDEEPAFTCPYQVEVCLLYAAQGVVA